MESIDVFLLKIAQQFEDADVKEITSTTHFQALDEWCSLTAMTLIAFIKTEYSKSVTGKEIRSCITLEDLYNLIDLK
jgi:acyl carrier protein